MKIYVPMRDNENFTNKRNRCLAQGFEALGQNVIYTSRSDPSNGADLIIHTGFAGTTALLSAVDEGIPYIITEHPTWRGPNAASREEAETTLISWSYNGLLGGGFHHPAPEQPRPHPELQPLKTEGATLVYAQKPNDHSLRGSDHVTWLKKMLTWYPDAELRHHPIMLNEPAKQENIGHAIDRTLVAVTYTSTVGVEALIAGCVSNPMHTGSAAYSVPGRDREAWIHELSWWNITMKEAADRRMAQHVLEGYDEARERAEVGLVERPRGRVDRDVTMQEYYKEFGNGD